MSLFSGPSFSTWGVILSERKRISMTYLFWGLFFRTELFFVSFISYQSTVLEYCYVTEEKGAFQKFPGWNRISRFCCEFTTYQLLSFLCYYFWNQMFYRITQLSLVNENGHIRIVPCFFYKICHNSVLLGQVINLDTC